MKISQVKGKGNSLFLPHKQTVCLERIEETKLLDAVESVLDKMMWWLFESVFLIVMQPTILIYYYHYCKSLDMGLIPVQQTN